MTIPGSTLLPEALFLDLPEIDAQHEEIFVRIEALKETCLEANALPVEDAEALLHCLADHFATEERLAREAGIYFSDHTRLHRSSLTSISRAIHDVRGGTQNVFCLLRYLEYWFERHITDADRVLAERLNSRDTFRSASLPARTAFRPAA